ncbi:MAG: hypothetical protein ABEH90_07090 [Halolamina sp.]
MAGPSNGGSADQDAIPFDGIVLQQAAALGSIGPGRLPELLGRVDAYLTTRRRTLRRQYERVHRDEERELFLVPDDYWPELGADLGLDEREWQAARRAHENQLLRVGSVLDRREEFETALEIRSAVVVGRE